MFVQQSGQQPVDAIAVGQTREGVVAGLIGQLFGNAPPFGDVGEHGDHMRDVPGAVAQGAERQPSWEHLAGAAREFQFTLPKPRLANGLQRIAMRFPR